MFRQLWLRFGQSPHGIPEVFAESTRGTRTPLDQIILHRLHVSLKAVSPDDLVGMWTSNDSRVDQGVQSLDGELRTCEAHHRGAATDILS